MGRSWRAAEKGLYIPGTSPELVEVGEFGFFAIEGSGSPDEPAFGERVGALYAASYTVRMAPKSGLDIPGWEDYTVYPLEGIWDLSEAPVDGRIVREKFIYTIMIRQPVFVDEAAADVALSAARAKKPIPRLAEVVFVRFEEGLCVQALHVGPYATEPATIEAMTTYCEENNLARTSTSHHEIYLSDPSRTDPDALRTTLRFTVERV